VQGEKCAFTALCHQARRNLSSVVQRAGGLNGCGVVDGAVFTAEDLKKSEQEQTRTFLPHACNVICDLWTLQSVRRHRARVEFCIRWVNCPGLCNYAVSRRWSVGLVIDLPHAMHAEPAPRLTSFRGVATVCWFRRRQEVCVIGAK